MHLSTYIDVQLIRSANGQLQIDLRLYIQFTPWSPQLAPANIGGEAFPTAA